MSEQVLDTICNCDDEFTSSYTNLTIKDLTDDSSLIFVKLRELETEVKRKMVEINQKTDSVRLVIDSQERICVEF